MIKAELFTVISHSIYLLVLLLVLVQSILVVFSSKTIGWLTIKGFIIFIFLLYIILFGFRSYSIGSDTEVYKIVYEGIVKGEYLKLKDIGFTIYNKLLSWAGTRSYFIISSVVYIIPITYLVIKLKRYSLFLLFGVISLFSFYALGVNIMRQGIAISFSLLGVYYFLNEKKYRSAIYFIIGFSFHPSIILIPLLCLLARNYLSLKGCLYVFIVATALSQIGQSIIIFLEHLPGLSILYESRLSSYIEGTHGAFYKVGFKVDFFLFNLFYILIGIISVKKNVVNKYYIEVLKVFVLLSSVFVIFFNLPYSDRTGVLSWVFIPYLQLPLVYSNNRYRNLTIFLFLILNVGMFYLFI